MSEGVIVAILIVALIVPLIVANFRGSKSRKSSKPPIVSSSPVLDDSDDIEQIRNNFGLNVDEIQKVCKKVGVRYRSGRISQKERDKIVYVIVNGELGDVVPPQPNVGINGGNTTRKNTGKDIPPVIKDKGHKIPLLPMTTIKDEVISRSVVPAESSHVFTMKGKEYILGSLIASGGEGSVYDIKDLPDFVAKVYDVAHNTVRRREKLSQMLQDKLKQKGVCLPRDLIRTASGEFTGYIMPRARGSVLQSLFNPHILKSKFPNWKKVDMISLSIDILRKIKYLHDHDVIIGDINPLNILVVSSGETYFVDTDSYQYKSFPCPVGTPEYTAPEIQGRDFGNFLRTNGNENFTVAMLVFRLMMQGQSPYAYQGGGNPVENIKKGLFPYGVGGLNVPDVWNTQPMSSRATWSHLMRDLKFAFRDTFHKDGRCHSEESRYSADVWLGLMIGYQKCLPRLVERSSDSGEIFPTTMKPKG